MAGASGPTGGAYPRQLAEASRLVAGRLGRADSWRLAYQSRSGPPSVPWLGPDVCDHLADLAGAGAPGAVLVPVGFVSDHVEVRYDLDVEAAQLGQRLGLPLARAATPGTHPRFVSMVTELVRERAGGLGSGPGERRPGDNRVLGVMEPGPDRCPGMCCRPQPPAHGDGRPGGDT
jgi:ferrochelatase